MTLVLGIPWRRISGGAVALALLTSLPASAQRRLLQPEDLLRVERASAITWTADRAHASVELRRPGRWIDGSIPTARLAVVDAVVGTLRVISPSSPAYVGFFGARWSPSGRRLLFLSIDTVGVVRPWIWAVGAAAPELLRNLVLHEELADDPIGLWRGDDHAIFVVRDSGQRPNGPLYAQIQRGGEAAEAWRAARDGKAAVRVLESRAPDTASAPARIVSLDLRTRRLTTLARGPIHQPRLSPDGRTLSFRREVPPIPAARVPTFFDSSIQGDEVYDLPNFGGRVEHVDASTGEPVPPPDTVRAATAAPSGVALRVTNDTATGTTLWLTRPGRADTALWRGNTWVSTITFGTAESIAYTSQAGRPLTGWLLRPRGHQRGRPLPIVTVVYPGSIYGERPPGAFSIFNEHFEHPQMFAALGYGVVYPSMPEPEQPLQARALDSLTSGVLPLLDTLIARGIADSNRIAILGQSAGGWATLGLITQTDRFRTAIASASYANLTSLYGTFYGQYRHGDAGRPLHAQVLRMLQFERGYYGAGAPPWEQPERYRSNSPIERVGQVKTPLMLIHGEIDFIPIQQAEEFFTAMYRRDQRVKLLRYAGEGHTIAARENVLDMWRRIADWLRETMGS